MSGRALAYLTDFLGADSDTEVPKSTLRTPYWERVFKVGFCTQRSQDWKCKLTFYRFRIFRLFAIVSNMWDDLFEVM